jgi:hypothetical protein
VTFILPQEVGLVSLHSLPVFVSHSGDYARDRIQTRKPAVACVLLHYWNAGAFYVVSVCWKPKQLEYVTALTLQVTSIQCDTVRPSDTKVLLVPLRPPKKCFNHTIQITWPRLYNCSCVSSETQASSVNQWCGPQKNIIQEVVLCSFRTKNGFNL